MSLTPRIPQEGQNVQLPASQPLFQIRPIRSSIDGQRQIPGDLARRIVIILALEDEGSLRSAVQCDDRFRIPVPSSACARSATKSRREHLLGAMPVSRS